MKKYITLILLLIVGLGNAQTTIKKSSIASGGNAAIQGNITLISNIGEVAIQEQSNTNILISEGFIAPDIYEILGVENMSELTGIQVYPNPAIDFVKIHFSKQDNYQVQLFDLNGKLILDFSVDSDIEKIIPLKNLQAGGYLLLVRKDNQSKVYKIIKS